MLEYGTVEEIKGYEARVSFKALFLEDMWLKVPQKFTVTKKSKTMPEIGQLVAVILTEDMADGVILGGLYNDEDLPPDNLEDDFVQYEDGSFIVHKKNSNTFEFSGSIICDGDISDKNGTLDGVRNHSNTHIHSNGNNGGNTGEATTKI